MSQTITMPSGAIATVQIMKNASGQKAARIFTPKRGFYFVPVEICALAAGSDSWMREITVKCNDCGERFKCGDMDGGACLCPTCYDKAGAEIEAMDNA